MNNFMRNFSKLSAVVLITLSVFTINYKGVTDNDLMVFFQHVTSKTLSVSKGFTKPRETLISLISNVSDKEDGNLNNSINLLEDDEDPIVISINDYSKTDQTKRIQPKKIQITTIEDQLPTIIEDQLPTFQTKIYDPFIREDDNTDIEILKSENNSPLSVIEGMISDTDSVPSETIPNLTNKISPQGDTIITQENSTHQNSLVKLKPNFTAFIISEEGGAENGLIDKGNKFKIDLATDIPEKIIDFSIFEKSSDYLRVSDFKGFCGYIALGEMKGGQQVLWVPNLNSSGNLAIDAAAKNISNPYKQKNNSELSDEFKIYSWIVCSDQKINGKPPFYTVDILKYMSGVKLGNPNQFQ
jgi:hypothetical protein